MVTGINKSKTLTKYTSCKCKCKFDGRKCSSNQKWNNKKFWYECKKNHLCKKNYVWNSATCSFKNGKNLASIIDDSVVMCDKIIEEETRSSPMIKKQKPLQHFLMENAIFKTQNFCILLAFLLIPTVLLIVASVCCYLIKYWVKQKHLLPYLVAIDKVRNVI